MLNALFSEIVRQLQSPLVLFGFAAQFVFFLRFAVQWYVSERRGQSCIPVSFWYLSCTGGLMILVYAALKKDIVFTTASILSLAIYARNLVLIHRGRAPGGPAGAAGTQ
jgi:lipid-A-disaccharide synthase-like uncharacterized protein